MGVIIGLVLTSPSPPTDLLDQVLEKLSGRHGDYIWTLTLRGEVPEETLRRLLRHEDLVVASSAAVGEWLSDPKGSVRESLLDDWREAVLGDCSGQRDEYWLTEILRTDPELARRWMDVHLPSDPKVIACPDSLVSVAAASLGTSGRRELLSRLPDDHLDGWLISLLVGDDLEVYREFLAESRWQKRHLDPLTWPSSGDRVEDNPKTSPIWVGKAQLALRAGYSPEDVARARLGSLKFWSCEESAMWQSWIEGFLDLEQHEDILIRSLAREAIRIASDRRDDARRRERNEAVYGR